MLRGKHKLIREGARGDAVVVGEQRRGAGTRDWRQYIDARFQSGDGSVIEFSGHVLQSDIGSDFLEIGDVVPVRYDPADHRQIVLDVPRLIAQIAARHGNEQPARATDGEVITAPPERGAAPQPLTPDAVAAALDEMANLGELRHRNALSDAEYEAEKTQLQQLVRRRSSGAITEAEFDAANALRVAGLPAGPQDRSMGSA